MSCIERTLGKLSRVTVHGITVIVNVNK